MKRFLIVSLASVALSTLAPVVRADVVNPAPVSCPEGGRPSTCHGGPHCRALGCMSDADCEEGLVCQDRSLCVGVVNCAGNIPPDADPAMFNVQTVEGTCSPDAPCDTDAGGTCTTLKVCVPSISSGSGSSSTGTPPADMGTESSCSCRLGATTGRLGALALSFGTLMSLALRRRKKR